MVKSDLGGSGGGEGESEAAHANLTAGLQILAWIISPAAMRLTTASSRRRIGAGGGGGSCGSGRAPGATASGAATSISMGPGVAGRLPRA